MMTKQQKRMALTTLVCLLPILFSLAVYQDLPAQIPSRWDFAGQVSGYTSKAVGAFGMPVFFAVMNLVLQFALYFDPKRKNHAKAVLAISVWMMPVMSLAIVPISLLVALGWEIPMHKAVLILVGVLFVFLGNYMPKTKQNYTMGIRLPWTLHCEENWNKTHRLAGRLWVLCGAVMIVLGLLAAEEQGPAIYGVFGVLIVSTLIPMVYSYLLYRKMEGAAQQDETEES